MKKILSILILFTFYTASLGQENPNLVQKITKKIFSSESDSSRAGSFFILPALAYAQETGLEYGFASTYNFYMDKKDLASKTSNITLIGTLTSKSQKKINLNTDIWTKNNDYHILLELRARDWPFNFYGIGNDTWKNEEDYIDQRLYRIKADIEKKVDKNLYIGINSSYDNYKFNDVESGGIYAKENFTGKLGGQYVTFGISTLYDSRNNTTYSTNGVYTRLKLAYAPNFFKSEDYTGLVSEIDIRGFKSLKNNLTLAIQGIYRGTYGKNTPFYAMRDLGGDMTMRGYYLGRYKDKNYLASQAELRYRFHPRLGVMGFIGTGSTFSKQNDIRLVPSYGGGLRYFYSIEHSSSIRLDYAYGEKRTGEERQSGFYLSISEAF